MPRRDLRATTTFRERVECVFDRQLHLLGIPSACEACGHRLSVIDLHPETIEAQSTGSIRERLGFVAETVARFAGSTASTQHGVRRGYRSRRPQGAFVERQLAIVFVPPNRPRSISWNGIS